MLEGKLIVDFILFRKLSDSKSAKLPEETMIKEDIEDELSERFSMLDIEDDTLSFKEN